MLDIYRFVLALFVIQGHILAWRPHWLAWQAVFSFYVLSGFLMTLVLNEAYGFAFSGILRFATNRWLRLFPMYFAVIGLTALYLAAVGPLSNLNSAIALPSSTRSLLANISIVGLLGFDPKQIATIRLAPTAWSLGIELFCYGLLAVYFAKSIARLLMMLLVGAVVTGMQIVGALGEADYGFQGHYTVLQAGLVPFAMGGLAYFAREAAIFRFAWWKLFLLGALFFANVLAGYAFEFHRGVSGLYVAALLNVFLVPMLFAMPTNAWCKTTGGLAYPIFLSHWFVATLIIIYMPFIARGSIAHFGATVIGSTLLCALLYFSIDRPLQAVRRLIKQISQADAARQDQTLTQTLEIHPT